MKKLIAITLALLMLVGLAACGKTENGTGQADPPANTDGAQPGGADDDRPADTPAENAALTGKLVFIEADGRDPSVLRGVAFSGNRSGSAEFNGRIPGTEGVRCIFELNEYVAGIPDTDAETGLEVYVLLHREDQTFYETAQFSEETPGFAALYRMERNEGDDWGEFYLNPEDAAPGCYDFVFVYEGKAIATLLTRFYNEKELEGKSDAELEALMLG